ncbi:DUF4352 domain-containing protein [Isoptericola sp. b515]|uniref:DUF4352 domain-containing protein n=1 Tax=Isoptericola sp. b515 TaxID=3064652 RepID=UPI0027144739|nr:DUF4352 domain-containing protein [Isoptericola sp. b515]MDO8147526.1 DUF4352 domain-containing protein [Isoptericola sp. b515]
MSDQQQHPEWSPQPAQQPVPPQQSPAQPGAEAPRKSWFARHKVLTGLGVLVGLAIVGSAVSGGGEEDPAVAGTTAEVSSEDSGTQEDAPAEDQETTDGVDDAAGDESGAEEQAGADAKPAGIGDPVRDGKFEFTVTELERGVEKIGNEYLNTEAQGKFVLVHMSVENIGDEAQYFDGSSQKLVDTEGRTHSADSEAAIYLDDSNSFLNEINPGNTVDGIVVFDMPKDAKPATLELHDSAFSGGVEVSVK